MSIEYLQQYLLWREKLESNDKKIQQHESIEI